MLALALDTTARAGSVALVRDGALVGVHVGDPAVTHGRRLPGDALQLLADHGCTLGDVDVFAVASGPGSFTGLRVGIATIQGFAFATGSPIVPVSTLDARLFAARHAGAIVRGAVHGVLMDAQRGEVFGAAYRGDDWLDPGDAQVAPPVVGRVADVLASFPGPPARLLLIGAARPLVAAAGITLPLDDDSGPLAPAIAHLGVVRAHRGMGVTPHAVQPLYVRRPDAELARDRRPGAPSP